MTAQTDVSTERTLVLRWDEPAGINPRGTLVILTGRGETPEVYQRFGTRLAADAYRVVAVTTSASEGSTAGGAAVQAVRAILDDPATVTPVVLVGSDTGALHALHVASQDDAERGGEIAAVVVAGLPTDSPHAALDWADEIAVRTACPNHQGVLGRAARGGIWTTPERSGAAAIAGFVAAPSVATDAPLPVPRAAGRHIPVLAVHGAADQISPVRKAVAALDALPAVELNVLEGGLHDILNDVTHRSVAATIVLFLERLRLDPGAQRIVRPVRSSVVPDGER